MHLPHATLSLALAGLALLAGCAASSDSAATSEPAFERPNILLIMADDLGYGDLSCYGATGLETPHIDRLAGEGQRFTSGYCSASTCTPSRYSLLTGSYAFRKPGTGIAAPNSPALIPAGTPTLASALRSVGYRTAIIGKWHLGLGEGRPDWNGELKPGPLELGFEHCLLLPTTNDRVPQVFVEDHRVANLDPADPLWVGDEKPSAEHPTGKSHRDELKLDWSHGHNSTIHNGISRIGFYTGGQSARFRDEDLADTWVERSIAWIEADPSRPFFLFFSSHDLHVPRIVHERFQGISDLGPRGDAILELDWCVGELTGALERLGLSESTLVIFCSDNGPVLDDGYRDQAIERLGAHRPAGPYRGGKYNVFEGGTRTPFITRWKGRIAPGESDQMVCTIDLPSSLAALSGASIPEHAFLDSLDLSGALLGRAGAQGREHLVQQDNGQNGNFGLRVGHWKLLRHGSGRTYNAGLRLQGEPVPRTLLFDLREDPGESLDLSAEHPKLARDLELRLDAILEAGRTRPATGP